SSRSRRAPGRAAWRGRSRTPPRAGRRPAPRSAAGPRTGRRGRTRSPRARARRGRTRRASRARAAWLRRRGRCRRRWRSPRADRRGARRRRGAARPRARPRLRAPGTRACPGTLGSGRRAATLRCAKRRSSTPPRRLYHSAPANRSTPGKGAWKCVARKIQSCSDYSFQRITHCDALSRSPCIPFGAVPVQRRQADPRPYPTRLGGRHPRGGGHARDRRLFRRGRARPRVRARRAGALGRGRLHGLVRGLAPLRSGPGRPALSVARGAGDARADALVPHPGGGRRGRLRRPGGDGPGEAAAGAREARDGAQLLGRDGPRPRARHAWPDAPRRGARAGLAPEHRRHRVGVARAREPDGRARGEPALRLPGDRRARRDRDDGAGTRRARERGPEAPRGGDRRAPVLPAALRARRQALEGLERRGPVLDCRLGSRARAADRRRRADAARVRGALLRALPPAFRADVTSSAATLLRRWAGAAVPAAGASAGWTQLGLALKYGVAGGLRARSPLVARRCAGLLGRERADPALHRARAEALLARTLRAARRIPAHAGAAARAPASDLLAWLSREVPIMDKASLKTQRETYYPNRGRRLPWWPLGESSGSTGSPTEVFRSLDSILWEEAFHRQHWRWAGVSAAERQAVLRGDRVKPLEDREPPYWLEDRVGRQLVLSTRHLDER